VPDITERKPVGFMSYVHADDEADEGRLTEFRVRLEREVGVQTGVAFTIFQDREDIHWGDAWRERVESSIDNATFLIPIITPSFFASDQCRAEFERFTIRERELNRTDLIFPVYYVSCPSLEDETTDDGIAEIIKSRQYTDWRKLRFGSLSSSRAARRMALLARQLGAALTKEGSRTAQDQISGGTKGVRAASATERTEQVSGSTSNLPNLIGLVRVFDGFYECQAEILREVRRSKVIKIFVQMGKSVLSGAAIVYNALERARSDAEIKILHAGSENPYLSERVALKRDSNYNEWREDISYVVRTGSRLKDRLGSRMEVRKHSEGYFWRFFLFDDHVYLQPYLFTSDNADKAPVLKFSRFDRSEATDKVNESSIYHMLETYFDLKWEECAPKTTRLDDMIAARDRTAVVALVEHAGVWVFVIPKRLMNDPGEELAFHSIGGKRQAGEDWIEALQREAVEEIGVELDVKSSPLTRDITTSAEFDSLTLSDSPRPYCVYKRTRAIDTEIAEPEVLWIVGFEATLKADYAEPRSEIAAIVYLSSEMLKRTARERITYDDIRSAGDGSGLRLQPGIEFDYQRIAVPTRLAALPTFRAQGVVG
jgi:8-oxo-dGTP pyrophosphatase MutT (NUDIX family)